MAAGLPHANTTFLTFLLFARQHLLDGSLDLEHSPSAVPMTT